MDEQTFDELLQEVRNNQGPVTSKRTVRSVEGVVAHGGVAYSKQTFDFMEGQVLRSVEWVTSFTCGHGHALDDQTRIVAFADCCGAPTCTRCGNVEDLTCFRCGRSLCLRHRRRFKDHVYCGGCFGVAVVKFLIVG